MCDLILASIIVREPCLCDVDHTGWPNKSKPL